MGLFKDFKDDFSQAVNEMMPGAEEAEKSEKVDKKADLVADTIGEKVDVKSELSKLDGLLEQVKTNAANIPTSTVTEPAGMKKEVQEIELPPLQNITKEKEEGNKKMSDLSVVDNVKSEVEKLNSATASDETSVISTGTVITGDIASDGSFDVKGTINGNVTCNGKLVVTGTVNGNSAASEIFADVAKIEGEVVSSGTVKIGAGSVIIGNISATSAVIAGAVKGDIDVQGPVVVDTSAVVMGNIKSRSVQINNGAVIEGFCSQCYADVDVQGLFEAK